MDIQDLINNEKYSDTLDGIDIEFTYSELSDYRLLIYEGYFSDIFGEPDFSKNEWVGFTRDYQQMEKTFEFFSNKPVKIDDIDEYLSDLYTYKEKMNEHEYEESREVYKLICYFLEYAKQEGLTVMLEQL